MAVSFAVVGLGMEARRVKTCVCMHGLIHDSPPEAFVVAEEPQKFSNLPTATPPPPGSGVSVDSLEASPSRVCACDRHHSNRLVQES